MKRIEIVKKHIHIIINNFDSNELYKLLVVFQGSNIMYGYAVATIMAFEENKIGMMGDKEVLEIMKKGEYDKLFDEWLKEDVIKLADIELCVE